MCYHRSNDHEQEVLDQEEMLAAVAHGRAEITERAAGDGAEDHVEQQPQQQVQVQGDDEAQPQAVIQLRPGLAAARAHPRVHDGGDADDERPSGPESEGSKPMDT